MLKAGLGFAMPLLGKPRILTTPGLEKSNDFIVNESCKSFSVF